MRLKLKNYFIPAKFILKKILKLKFKIKGLVVRPNSFSFLGLLAYTGVYIKKWSYI